MESNQPYCKQSIMRWMRRLSWLVAVVVIVRVWNTSRTLFVSEDEAFFISVTHRPWYVPPLGKVQSPVPHLYPPPDTRPVLPGALPPPPGLPPPCPGSSLLGSSGLVSPCHPAACHKRSEAAVVTHALDILSCSPNVKLLLQAGYRQKEAAAATAGDGYGNRCRYGL